MKTKFSKSGLEESPIGSSLANTPATASRHDHDSLALSQERSKSTARNDKDIDDPLKGLALDLSSEVSAEESLRRKDGDESETPANLDSTIIIGDIEEGNIFDNFNAKSPREESQDIVDKKSMTIPMDEL